MKRVTVALALSSCLLVNGADLDTAYNDALQNDPTLAIAVASHKVAKQNAVPLALANVLPRISLSANERQSKTERSASNIPDGPDFTGFFSSNKVRGRGWSLSVSQSIVNVENWQSLRSARKRSTAADWDLTQSMQDLIFRVAQGYLAVLRAQDQLESTIAAEEAISRQLEQAQQRFNVGLVAITDVLNATADYDAAVVTRLTAAEDVGLNFESLRVITGVDYDALARISEDLPVMNPEPPDENAWVDEALRNSPLIHAAKLAFEASKHDRLGALSTYLPTVNLSGSMSHSEDPDNVFGQETDSSSLTLSMSMPIFQGGRNISRVRQTLFQQERARAQLTQTELTTTRNTRQIFRQVVTDAARVKANLQAIQSRQSALDATQTGYEVGTRNIVDVLQAQRQLYSSIFQYATSRYTYIENGLRLKQTVGTLSAEDLAAINTFADPDNPVTKVMSLSGK